MKPRRSKLAVAVAVAVYLSATRAAAEPVPAPTPDLTPWHIVSASTLTTEGGSTEALPAGVVILRGEAWEKLDVEIRRLQDAETRLAAENVSLRESLTDGGGPGWATLTAFVAGAALGIGGTWYALHR